MKRVLIFDSGVGGLSVYQEIKQRLPQAQYIYAFDDAGFPYGELTATTLIERTQHIVSTLTQKHQVDLVVIACNTASTVVLPSLRACLSIPIVGVVPAIKPAAQLSKNKCIGLLATPATVKREYTNQLIEQFAMDCQVLRIGSTRLVEMAEEKLLGKPVDIAELTELLMPWHHKVDSVVLGCTHFPLFKDEIAAALPQPVNIVDSGRAIANRVAFLLQELNPLATEPVKHYVYNSVEQSDYSALYPSLERLGFSCYSTLGYPRV